MQQARLQEDGTAAWVEVCYCGTPLQEERPYWEQYFELVQVKDAHSRRNCRHENGTEPWACSECTCTLPLEKYLSKRGKPFLETLSETTSKLGQYLQYLLLHPSEYDFTACWHEEGAFFVHQQRSDELAVERTISSGT